MGPFIAGPGLRKRRRVRPIKTMISKYLSKMSSRRATSVFTRVAMLAVICTGFLAVVGAYAHAQQLQPQGNVLNAFGAPVGAVDKRGVVSTAHGSRLGSVDADGNVYNVSSIFIGRVYPNGDIFNQAGDFLGYVDADGKVYNVSDFKLGSVRAGGNVFLAGGAARIIFFRASRGGPIRPVPLPRPR